MENIGIKKEIDKLGRLQIPKDIRNTLGLTNEVEMVVTDEGLLIKSTEYTLIKIATKNDCD